MQPSPGVVDIAYRDMCQSKAEQIKRVIQELKNGTIKQLTYRKTQVKSDQPDWEAAYSSAMRKLESELRCLSP